jgi:hypothetical protein
MVFNVALMLGCGNKFPLLSHGQFEWSKQNFELFKRSTHTLPHKVSDLLDISRFDTTAALCMQLCKTLNTMRGVGGRAARPPPGQEE